MQPAPALAEVPMSEGAFLAWADTREERYELVEGMPMMQAGPTRDHERVAKRVFVALLAQVDARLFDVNKGDFGVRIRPGNRAGSVLLPDVLVDLQSGDGSERVTENPIVVVEVLSESTDYDQHVAKLALYRLRPSLRQYVVFEQRVPRAYVWDWRDGEWPAQPRVVEGMDTVVTFPTVGAEVRLSEVYRKRPDSGV